MSNFCHYLECFIAGGSDRCVHLRPPVTKAQLRPRVENKKATRKFFVSGRLKQNTAESFCVGSEGLHYRRSQTKGYAAF